MQVRTLGAFLVTTALKNVSLSLSLPPEHFEADSTRLPR